MRVSQFSEGEQLRMEEISSPSLPIGHPQTTGGSIDPLPRLQGIKPLEYEQQATTNRTIPDAHEMHKSLFIYIFSYYITPPACTLHA